MVQKDIFREEYKKLNQAQREAVEAIDGPVMVIAGPGTGKTQILALRIGNILLKTDTKADGILCLTFTKASVGAMKERLRKYIGSTGLKVNIFTFHGKNRDFIKLISYQTVFYSYQSCRFFKKAKFIKKQIQPSGKTPHALVFFHDIVC